MNQPKLTISLLGGVTIALDGTAVSNFVSRKADALFVYLACNPRPHPRETLATLFWPDNDQTRALANLSVILSSLRKQLNEFLITDRHTVSLNIDAAFWLDVAAFEQAIEAAQKRPQADRISRTVAAQLQTAVTHYKGDFLAGFNIRGVPEFEAWMLLEQERLRQMMLDTLSDLIAFHQQRGQFSNGIQHAQRLLALDPLQEEAHRQLMRLYALDNQRPTALAQFEQCVAVLADELGIEPDEETNHLYEQLKDEKSARAPENLKTVTPQHNLPAATTSFIGRENELAHIKNWLTEPNGRLLTIIGPGGIGKTRLAQEAARTCLGQFADGVWYISLVPLIDEAGLITAVAETIGLTFTGNIDPTHQLISYLTNKEMLLILDNFEHLITGQSVGFLTQLINQTPELKLLVTSRGRLNLQAEQLLELAGLPFPATSHQNLASDKPHTAHQLPITDYPAVQLFANRASKVRSDFDLVGQETAVAKLCQLVAGLPLALELAATWSRTLTVTEIVAEIEQGIDFLATTMRDLPERHRSVRAVFAYSWQLLSSTEKEVFSRLSVCRGGFSRQAAQHIANASLLTLRSLIDKSFIRLDAATSGQIARYRRHPLLIQFAAEQLAQQPEKLAESQQKLAGYIADTLANHTDKFYGPERQKAMALMTAEHENVRISWQWAIENEPRLLEKMASSYQYFLASVGLFSEGYEKFNHAVSSVRQPEQQLLRAQLLVPLCMFARLVGQTSYGKEMVLESLAILDRLQSAGSQQQIEALALKQYGSLLFSDDNNYSEAEKINEQALALFQTLNDLVGQGEALNGLGVVAYFTGNYQKAIKLIEDSLLLQERASNQIGQMINKQILGLIHTSLGNFAEAIDYFHACITLAEVAHYRVDVPWHQLNLGNAYLLSGQLSAAYQTLKRSLHHSLEQGDPQAISGAYSLLGMASLHNGRFSEAHLQARQGLRYSQEPGLQFPFYQAFALQVLGSVALAEGNTRRAFEQSVEASDLFRKIEHLEYLSCSLSIQLMAACALKRFRRAKALAQETIELVQKLEAYLPKLLAVTALAIWACQQNQADIGSRLWATISQENLVAQSAWFQAIAQQQLQPILILPNQSQQKEEKARTQTIDFLECVGLIRPLLT
ncbi:BTAD domain-containing putative transcriptional regulator [Candidatus Leptofilum sp.]|uniref:BTAD domain-containing putative transcriptional regulator n=1 Tax=Candidatus Leptofilum sp. TaxID=3241576 RepID=UPI003B5A2D99